MGISRDRPLDRLLSSISAYSPKSVEGLEAISLDAGQDSQIPRDYSSSAHRHTPPFRVSWPTSAGTTGQFPMGFPTEKHSLHFRNKRKRTSFSVRVLLKTHLLRDLLNQIICHCVHCCTVIASAGLIPHTKLLRENVMRQYSRVSTLMILIVGGDSVCLACYTHPASERREEGRF